MGSASTTTSSAGEYNLSNAISGNTSVTVVAAGFDSYTKNVTLTAGANALSALIIRVNTLYSAGNVSVYLPSGVTKIRGVLLTLYGGTVDGRQLLRGELDYYAEFPLVGDVANYRVRTMAFARQYGLAVMGTVTRETPNAAAITQGLSAVAALTGHPELAQSPLVVTGNSNGACMAYDLAAREPGRVIGFISQHALCTTVTGTAAEAARTVPGYFIVGDADPQVPDAVAAQIRAVFNTGRTAGAPWAFAVEPGGTHKIVDFGLTFGWLAAVLADRLIDSASPTAPSTLRPVTESAGWLGDLSSFAIAGYGCFSGAPRSASWLPSQLAAQQWQGFVSRNGVMTRTVC